MTKNIDGTQVIRKPKTSDGKISLWESACHSIINLDEKYGPVRTINDKNESNGVYKPKTCDPSFG